MIPVILFISLFLVAVSQELYKSGFVIVLVLLCLQVGRAVRVAYISTQKVSA